jgi:hypothetical protein
VRIFTKFSVDSESAIKIRISKIGIFAQKAPAGTLRELFYKYLKKRPLREYLMIPFLNIIIIVS